MIDSVNGARYGFNDFWMNLHHVVIFSCYLSGFYYNNSAVENLAALFVGELSNPFNILRKAFDRFEDPKRSAKMSIVFALTFLPIRGFICSFICYDTVLNPNLSYLLKINSSLMGNLLLIKFSSGSFGSGELSTWE